MSATGPLWLTDAEGCAERILSKVGKDIALGLPLGLGKANSIFNALYAAADRDPTIRLDVYTALTLGRPIAKSDLERRLLEPLFERMAGNYPELAYTAAIHEGRVPENISIHEFYFPAGRRLNTPMAQQSYTSTNYTHAVRDLLDRNINVITQLVAHRHVDGRDEISLSCNPDLTADLLPALKERRKDGQPLAIAGQVNEQLPFMLGPAVIDSGEFDYILHGPQYQFDLFAVPKRPVSLNDYATAIHVTSLIADGGTLQIGIGDFADALTHTLRLRHLDNDQFRNLARNLGTINDKPKFDELGVFEKGLYACSEMLVEGLLELKRIGVLKRRASGCSRSRDEAGADPMIHSAFFLGSKALYKELRNLSEEDMSDIAMTSVSFVNQLYGNEAAKRAHRKCARFINRGMIATALGAITSDALEDGRVVSGVGGQYNFVAQAHELPGGRSIIALDSVRTNRGETTSNIVWSYGHTTIPRHLRDIVVTEYGVADLRGKSDRDVVVAMLNITDSRFQPALVAEAKKAGKLEKGFTLPDKSRRNYPERIKDALGDAARRGILPEFPLGTEMTSVEIRLIGALKALKAIVHDKPKLLQCVLRGALGPPPSPNDRSCLERLQLGTPRTIREKLMRWSVLWGLRQLGTADQIT